MKTLPTLWLIISPAIGFHKPPSSSAFEDIVTEIQANYHHSCVLFLYSTQTQEKLGLKQSLWLLQMMKILSYHNILTASADVQTLTLSFQKFHFCPHKPPLCVVLSSDENTRHQLQKLSSSEGIEGPSWLHFLEEKVSLEKFFSGVYIPFNCKYLAVYYENDRILMTEVYFITSGGPLQTFPYGSWNNDRGTTITSRNKMYQRRSGLCGIVLKALSSHDPPFTELNMKPDGTVSLGGYLGQLWAHLEARMNFTTLILDAGKDGWGSLENGSWNGMVEMVRSGEVDLALSHFTMTKERQTIIDFTMPLIFTRYQVFIMTPLNDNLNWSVFLSPFKMILWVIIGSFILAFATLLSVLHKLGVRFGNEEIDAFEEYMVKDCILYVFAAFCQQGHDITPRSWSCRVVYLMAYLTGVVLLAAYSAALISFLTKQDVILPFKDLGGLLQEGTYKFSLLQRSAEFNIFETSNNPIINQIFGKHLGPDRDNLPKTIHEALYKLCLEDNQATLASMDEVLSFLRDSQLNCNLAPLPEVTFPASLSIITGKNSPYRDVINSHLQKLRDLGVLSRLRSKLWPKQKYKVKSPWTTVNFNNVAPIFVLLVISVPGAILVLAIECQIGHFMVKKRKLREKIYRK